MPQAVSLFPSPPPQSNSTSANQGNFDATSSRFDDVLSDAQQKDSSAAAPSDSSSNSAPDKTEKPAKEKTSKASTAKPADPKASGKGKVVPEQPAVDDAAQEVTATPVEAVPTPDSPQSQSPTKSKTKASVKPDAAVPQAKIDPNALQPQALPVKNAVEPQQRISISKDDGRDAQPADAVVGQPSIQVTIDATNSQPPAEPAAQPAGEQSSPPSAKPTSPPPKPVATGDLATSAVGVQPAAVTSQTGVSPSRTTAALTSPTSPSVDDSADATPIDFASEDAKSPAPQPASHHGFAEVLGLAQGPAPAPANASAPAAHVAPTPAPRLTPDAQFAEANHANIVSNVHSTLLPNGGSMQIKLNPPDLGAMDISVQMRNGTMTATFDTTNDQASRMLSHSLGQLKTALEGQGITVGALHVQQSPRNSETTYNSNHEDGKNQGNANNDASAQQQEQQRRDMLRKMWAKLSGDADPLDLVA